MKSDQLHRRLHRDCRHSSRHAGCQTPPEWSQERAELLAAAGKEVEYFEYEGQPHTFLGSGDALFIERMIEFYDRHLRE